MSAQNMIDMSALIATDDPKTERLTKGIFSKTEVTHTASAVLQAARSAKSQIIIMDLSMPGISPNQVIRRLKAMDCSVIVISSGNQVSEAGKALRSGALDYVVKPFTTEDLCTRISARLGPSRLQEPIRQSDAPLLHLIEKLHDPETGRLDAQRIAHFFGLKVAELARILKKRVGTVSKTSNAPALQEALRPLESIASGLLRLLGGEARVRMWLQAANPALDGHAPMELLRMGKIADLGDFVQDLLEGRPA
ncbi:MAG TPA: response regulator [Candidatus Angelobacter sp.]|nr:response regulator [Candidatus Angelobacter sp.]